MIVKVKVLGRSRRPDAREGEARFFRLCRGVIVFVLEMLGVIGIVATVSVRIEGLMGVMTAELVVGAIGIVVLAGVRIEGLMGKVMEELIVVVSACGEFVGDVVVVVEMKGMEMMDCGEIVREGDEGVWVIGEGDVVDMVGVGKFVGAEMMERGNALNC